MCTLLQPLIEAKNRTTLSNVRIFNVFYEKDKEENTGDFYECEFKLCSYFPLFLKLLFGLY